MGNVFKIKELRYIPRWSVFLIDVSVIFFSILVSYFLLNSLEVKLNFTKYQKEKIFSVVLINILSIVLFKTYAGIIRHSTFFDFFKIVWSSGSTLIVLLGLNFMSELILGKPVFLYPVLFLFFFVSIFLMFFFRMAIKKLFGVLIDSKDTLSKARIAIVGVEDTSVSLAKAIIHNPDHPYQLAGFLTARSDSKKARLLGHKIYNKKQFLKSDSLKEQFDAVLIKDVMTKQEIEEWTSSALDKGLKVLKVPITNIIKEDDKVRSIRSLQIEDLLNRPTIKIENNEVKCFHVNKNILVTGGAGSIGSEIVRQVAQLNSSLIVVVDQAESPLYELQLELLERFPNQRFKFILADISNYSIMEKLFDDYQFSIVYHAAAYKHVPLIEDNPHEAIFVNIGGTKNLALLSKKYNVNRFVMVSTDKAVNPTNVMGASKRAAELFVQSLQNSSENTTKFITTHFGNVLELLTDNCTTIPTHHEKIIISRDQLMKFEDIDILCSQIILSAMNKESLQIVRILKTIVPEFIKAITLDLEFLTRYLNISI